MHTIEWSVAFLLFPIEYATGKHWSIRLAVMFGIAPWALAVVLGLVVLLPIELVAALWKEMR